MGRQNRNKTFDLLFGSLRATKRCSSSSASSDTAAQQAWQRQALPGALLVATCYLFYDNRRKRLALEAKQDQVVLLEQQQQQLVAASALVVSEEQQQPEWPSPEHQSEAVKETTEAVVIDSVETQIDPFDDAQEKVPVDQEPQIQQDSGERVRSLK